MAFVIGKKKSVWWPVIILEPVNGGKVQRLKIELQFDIEDPDEWEETGDSIDQVLKRVIGDWKHVEAEDKTPVEFNDETLKSLLSLSYARTAIWAAYTGEVLPGAPSKN